MKAGLLFVLIFILTGCDPTDNKLKIRNDTEGVIFYSLSKNDSFLKNPLYIVGNDTILENSNMVSANSNFYHALIGPNEWEYFINRDCEDSTLRVFIFTKEFIMNNRWDSLVHNQQFSRKIEASVTDLQKSNWEILYK
jgi:hypothetical protein